MASRRAKIRRKAAPSAKLQYPTAMIFLLGGVAGVILNLGVTLLLYRVFRLHLYPSFFFGTLANELFHHLFYSIVYSNGEIRFRTPFPLHLFLYLAVALAAAALLGAVLRFTGWSVATAVLAVLAFLSVANAVLNRISTYSSATLARVEYGELEGGYYDEQTDVTKVSRFRAWYHRSRYERLTRLVSEHWRRGMRMADLGCANCHWNEKRIPVTGVDINAGMLKWAKSRGRLKSFRMTKDLSRTGLPAKKFDLVLMSEVLEHLPDPAAAITEVKRILKDKGTFLITVPWDFFLGPFFILFNLNCLFMAYVKGSAYHRFRCGHVNHFTHGRLKRVLAENGFELTRVFVVNGLLLYASARKSG